MLPVPGLLQQIKMYVCMYVCIFMGHETGDNKSKPRDDTCKACWMEQTLETWFPYNCKESERIAVSRTELQGVAIIVIGFHMIAKDRKESKLTQISRQNFVHGNEIIPRNNRIVIARSCKSCEQWFPSMAMDRNKSQ